MSKHKMNLFNIRNVFLVAILAVLAVCVHSGRVIRDRRETKSETTSDIGSSLSGFISNLRVSIESGAHQVKERVQGGYNYVKERLSSNAKDTEKTETTENDEYIKNNSNNRDNSGAAVTQNSDRIIFENDDEANIYEEIRHSVPIVDVGEISTIQPVTIDDMNKKNVTIGDRNAISAPIVCPKGQRLVDQKCVTIVEF